MQSIVDPSSSDDRHCHPHAGVDTLASNSWSYAWNHQRILSLAKTLVPPGARRQRYSTASTLLARSHSCRRRSNQTTCRDYQGFHGDPDSCHQL